MHIARTLLANWQISQYGASMKSILYFDSTNSFYSQLAECFTQIIWPGLFSYSAGCMPSKQLDRLSIYVMAEKAALMNGYLPKGLEDLPAIHFDQIVFFCDGEKTTCPSFLSTSRVFKYHLDKNCPIIERYILHQDISHYRIMRDNIFKFVSNIKILFPHLF